ncbi:hypothetical protein R6Q59_033114 [Mikania micrantha]
MIEYTDQEYRTYQLNSKWKDMSAKLMQFSAIYSNCANNRKSGMNDEGVLKWAEKEYQLKSNSQTFNHNHVWAMIKDAPKFHVLCQEANEGQRSTKRTKNSDTNAYSPGVRMHIRITQLTSNKTRKTMNSKSWNLLDRLEGRRQNELRFRVVKPPPLSRQPTNLLST